MTKVNEGPRFAAVYIRVSTDEQAELSPETQLAKIQEYARRGKLQATPSFGYRVEDGKLVPKPEESELVRWIFRSFVDGKGLYPIARELNAMGVRTHRGNQFENRTVEYILRNPVYIGKLRWNPSGRTRRDFFNENIIVADAEHEPLIEQELWDAARSILDTCIFDKQKSTLTITYRTTL